MYSTNEVTTWYNYDNNNNYVLLTTCTSKSANVHVHIIIERNQVSGLLQSCSVICNVTIWEGLHYIKCYCRKVTFCKQDRCLEWGTFFYQTDAQQPPVSPTCTTSTYPHPLPVTLPVGNTLGLLRLWRGSAAGVCLDSWFWKFYINNSSTVAIK